MLANLCENRSSGDVGTERQPRTKQGSAVYVSNQIYPYVSQKVYKGWA